MAIPLSPEEEARVASYYGGTPGVNMSDAGAPPMTAAPAAPDPIASYYGPPPPPPPVSTPPTGPSPVDEFKLGARLSEKPMAPPPPAGPTVRDNAEFEAFKARQTPKPKTSGGAAGPSAPSNPDPYGIKKADQQMVGSYDTQREGTAGSFRIESDRAADTSERAREAAKRRQEDIAAGFAEEQDGLARFDKSMSEVSRQIDDVRAKRVKPLEYMSDNPGLAAVSILGGIFGGIYQAVNHLAENPFLRDMNAMIDRQIAVDEKNIDNEKAALGQKMNLLSQQRAAFKDATSAKLQMRNLYYEAMKDEIAAEAAKYDSPLYTERGKIAIAEIDREQGKLMDALGKALAAKDQAAAAQSFARMKEVRDFRHSVYDKMLAAGYTPPQAEAEANRQTAITYAVPGAGGPRGPEEQYADGGGLTKEQRGKVAMEHQEAQYSSDEFNSQMDTLQKHPVLDQLGLGTAAGAVLGQRIAPESTKADRAVKMLNFQILQAAGKASKDAEGKPQQAMLDKIKDTYNIDTSDTKESALQKLQGVRDMVNSLARQTGASRAPVPHASVKTDAELGAKPVR